MNLAHDVRYRSWVSGARGPRSHPWYGWLPAVLPVDARRLRIDDPELAATFDGVGVELVDSQPDVEIGPVERLRGDAARAIATIAFEPRDGQSRVARALARGIGSIRLRVAARRERRRMRLAGYPEVVAIRWDFEHALRLPGKHDGRRSGIELLPLRAIVLGTRGDVVRTVFDEAVEAAFRADGASVEQEAPVVRAAALIVIGRTEVLRVAIGRCGHELEAQCEALNLLSAVAPARVAERIPSMLAHGKAGVGDWTLESRLRGAPPPVRPAGALLDECVDFLVALHTAVPGRSDERTISANADVVAGVCAHEQASELRRLAERLERRLADLPRGFAHGDFWGRNLLVDSERLVGVLDWAGAGTGRLPLLDLLHLHVSATRWTRNLDLGPVLVKEFLPWARAGADPSVRAYCQRLGLHVTRSELESLVVAYWLGRVAHELKTTRHRDQPAWLRRNVLEVLGDVAAHGPGSNLARPTFR